MTGLVGCSVCWGAAEGAPCARQCGTALALATSAVMMSRPLLVNFNLIC